MYVLDVYFFFHSCFGISFSLLCFETEMFVASTVHENERKLWRKHLQIRMMRSKKPSTMLPLTEFCLCQKKLCIWIWILCAWYTRNNFSVSYFPFCIVHSFLHRVYVVAVLCSLTHTLSLSRSLVGVYVFKIVYQTPRFCFASPSFRQWHPFHCGPVLMWVCCVHGIRINQQTHKL